MFFLQQQNGLNDQYKSWKSLDRHTKSQGLNACTRKTFDRHFCVSIGKFYYKHHEISFSEGYKKLRIVLPGSSEQGSCYYKKFNIVGTSIAIVSRDFPINGTNFWYIAIRRFYCIHIDFLWQIDAFISVARNHSKLFR